VSQVEFSDPWLNPFVRLLAEAPTISVNFQKEAIMSSMNSQDLSRRCLSGWHRAAFGLAACVSFAANAGTNLVENGGFEAGNFSGWTVSDTSLTLASTEDPHSGLYEANLGNRSLSTLEQTITTVAGTSYTVDLWIGRLGLLAGGDAFSVAVSFAGTTFVNLSAATLPLNSPYAEYSAAITAATSSSPLLITYVDQPSYILIDDVSVTAPVSAVPEPAGTTLLLAGLALVGFLAAKARRQGH
jgi:hypothetical protein